MNDISQGKIWSWDGTVYVEATDVQATDAIWVNAKNKTTVNLTGKKSDTKIELSSGWNMVGPTVNGYIPDAALTTFTYQDKMNQMVNEAALLKRGVGYWIFSL
jgi:hypothetical protein